MTVDEQAGYFEGDGNFLNLDHGDVCTTLKIYYKSLNCTYKRGKISWNVNFISTLKMRKLMVPYNRICR